MANEALAWAQSVKVGSSSAKFVLIMLARFAKADNEYRCFSSNEALVEVTELDRKTVINALKYLVDGGFLKDTGERGGKTRRMPVYKLLVEIVPEMGQLNSPESGTVKQSQISQKSAEIVPFFPPNSPVFPAKQSQKRDPIYKDINREVCIHTHNLTVVEESAVLWAQALCVEGLVVSEKNEMLRTLIAQGVELETVRKAVQQAVKSRGAGKFALPYVVGILKNWKREQESLDVQGVRAPAAQSAGSRFSATGFVNRNRRVT